MVQSQSASSSDLTSPPLPKLNGRYRLVCLGGFEWWQDNVFVREVGGSNHHYQTLLAYLALHAGKTQTRQQLAFQFWPDSTETQARTNLRKAIHHFRRHLPQVDEILLLERQLIQWRQDAPVQVDVVEFVTAVSQAQQAPNLALKKECLRQAIAYYQGDFLHGYYEDWVLMTREQLHQQYLFCLETLIQLLEREQDFTTAIIFANRLLQADSLHEEGYRWLIRLQLQNGRIAAALRTYHTCVATLQNELGVAPSLQTKALYEQLLQTSKQTIPSSPARTPLIARKEVWATLQTTWQQTVQRGSRLALIHGEAGIGKTRLAEELISWVERQGITTITSACYAVQGRLPYAPIASWLRTDTLQKGLSKLDDKWIVEISRLLPELLTERPDLSAPPPLTEDWQRQHFFTALAQVVLRARQPLLLCLDDLQWCDQDSLDWLHFLLHFDGQARFLLLATVRTEEVAPNHPLLTLQQHLRRDGLLTELSLSQLNATTTCTLAEQITQYELDPEQAKWLYAESEGNPLFVVEMARIGLEQLRAGQADPVVSLPDKVRSVLEMRLAQLSAPAQAIAELAATMGRSFTFDLLAATWPKDEDSLVAGLDELWQRRIIREKGRDAYDFSHDKLRQTAYARLSMAKRRLLHRRVVQGLEAGYAGSLDEIAHLLATHYEAIGNYAVAVNYCLRAAERAERFYAHQETLVHLQQALRLLSDVDAAGDLWVKVHERWAVVLTLLGQYDEARDALATAVLHTNNPIDQAQLLCQKGNTWIAQQQHSTANLAYNEALQKLGTEPFVQDEDYWWQTWLDVQLCRGSAFYFNAQLVALEALIEQLQEPITAFATVEQQQRWLELQNMFAFRQKRFQLDAEDVLRSQQILELAQQGGDEHQIAAGWFGLGFTYIWTGSIAQAIDYLTRTQKQAEASGNVYLQDQSLAYLILAYRMDANQTVARALLKPHELLVAQSENPFYAGMLAGQYAWLAFCDGDWKTAVTHGKKALTLWGKLPFPLQWIAKWPLLATAVSEAEFGDAIQYATEMLEPSQQILEERVTAVLQQAIDAWENDQPMDVEQLLPEAVQLAIETHYI